VNINIRILFNFVFFLWKWQGAKKSPCESDKEKKTQLVCQFDKENFFCSTSKLKDISLAVKKHRTFMLVTLVFSTREKVVKFLQSNPVQIILCVIVLLDAGIVVAQILLDLKSVKGNTIVYYHQSWPWNGSPTDRVGLRRVGSNSNGSGNCNGLDWANGSGPLN